MIFKSKTKNATDSQIFYLKTSVKTDFFFEYLEFHLIRSVTFFILYLCISNSIAQPFHYYANTEQYSNFESKINKPASNFHSSIKPYYEQQLHPFLLSDSINNSTNFLKRILFDEHTIQIEKNIFSLTVNPLFAIVPSFNIKNKNTSAETNWGVSLQSKFNNKFIFAANLLYNYSSFNKYLSNNIDSLNVIPGQGYAHKTRDNYEYFNNSFYFAYMPSKYFIFETGLGKNFWGDGYRSMILSNNANNYTYFKIETNVWKIKYVNLWANFKDIRNSNSSAWPSFYNKYGSFHYLSWNVTKKFNLGIYEAIIWKHGDSASVRGFELNYANPIIFLRPVEFSLGSPDNALIGVNLKYTPKENIVFYSQFVIDDMVTSEIKNDIKHILKPKDSTINYGSWMNKQAFQFGVKFFDIFKIKNLFFQTELNAANPYTYSHREVYLNYANFNQSLAHPLGSNFMESYSIVRFNKNKWAWELKFMYAITGLDSANTHFGANIYQSTFDSYLPSENNIPVQEYKNHIGQGIATSIIFNEIKISYLINKKNNLRAEAGFIYRTQKTGTKTSQDYFFYLGIRTSIFDGYYDY